jgi:DNA-binding MarR family transcriptional regulator
VSRLVEEMQRHGLVERQANPADGRSTFAAITPAGRRRLRSAAPHYLRSIQEHFARHLSAGELASIGAALQRVLEGAR